MGARGPQPTPNDVKRQRGTLRSTPDRRAADAELVTTVPEPPKWLSLKAEKVEWAEAAEYLIAQGTFARADYDTLACYCSTKISWLKERKLARKHPITVAQSGNVSPGPHYKMAKEYLSDMQKLAHALGMTPASRTRLDAVPAAPAKQDDLIQ